MNIDTIELAYDKLPAQENYIPSYKTIRKKNDIGWKIVLEAFLADFMHFLFPPLAELIDWKKPPETLDTELHAISKEARQGSRIVDKLFKVYLRNGKEQWILIHIEVQGKKDPTLPERMFVSSYRIYDRYRQALFSCAILTDNDSQWCPDHFEVNLAGTSLSIKYHVIKLINFQTRIKELENSNNCFAQVILVQLTALKLRNKSDNEKFNIKIALTRKLYKKGFSKNQIINLYYFIDWLITLPQSFEIEYRKECVNLDKEENMAYISGIEYLGMQAGFKIGVEKGWQEGKQLGLKTGNKLGLKIGRELGIKEGKQLGIKEGLHEGESVLLIRQLTRKFGHIPEQFQQLIRLADVETLLLWGENLLDASTLEKVFEPSVSF